MNWLFREKIFTSYCNKYRSVIYIYSIKCGIKFHFLHNSGRCIMSMAPWIIVLSQHTVFTKKVIYYIFTFVWYSAKQGTTQIPVHIWDTYTLITQRRWVDDFPGHCLLWRILLRFVALLSLLVLLNHYHLLILLQLLLFPSFSSSSSYFLLILLLYLLLLLLLLLFHHLFLLFHHLLLPLLLSSSSFPSIS